MSAVEESADMSLQLARPAVPRPNLPVTQNE